MPPARPRACRLLWREEKLSEHSAVDSGVDHADPDSCELRTKNVLSVSWRIHQSSMGDGNRLGVGEILTRSRIPDPGGFDSVERRTRDRGVVTEIFQRHHLLGMRASDRDQTLVPFERSDPPLRALVVHEIE